jgi:hypothetical protein
MRKITESRTLIGAAPNTSLKELNGLYRSLMKAHHPDRFAGDEAKRQEAEEFSKRLIDAYKSLESIHPETHAANAEEFQADVASNILDWHYKSLTLHVTFGNGSAYEFYGVPQKTYNKFVAAEGNTRFAKRHVFGAFTFRKAASGKADEA